MTAGFRGPTSTPRPTPSSFMVMVVIRPLTRVAAMAAIVAIATSDCASIPPRAGAATVAETRAVLHAHALTVHVGVTPGRPGTPLILYATGDAGWWGADKEIFTQLVRWGYPVAGFSARDYVHHFGGKPTLTPAEVGADFAGIVRAAEASLQLAADTPVVLVGKSRGAGLAIAATSAPSFPLAGVLAVGLTYEEEYVRVPGQGVAPASMLMPYATLSALGDVPVAVVQSTRDEYVSADRARGFLGPDTPTRTLRPIASADHNFNGARDTMYLEMRKCFEWIVSR